MRKLLIQPQAKADLSEIWHYIAAQSPTAADKVGQKLDDALQGLLSMPGKGHKRNDVKDPQYRFWSVYSYIIVYRYDDTSLTVIRVIHGRRNLRTIFAQRP